LKVILEIRCISWTDFWGTLHYWLEVRWSIAIDCTSEGKFSFVVRQIFQDIILIGYRIEKFSSI